VSTRRHSCSIFEDIKKAPDQALAQVIDCPSSPEILDIAIRIKSLGVQNEPEKRRRYSPANLAFSLEVYQ
jgi:hypothetical protein